MQKTRTLLKRGSFSAWKKYHFVVENGFLMRYKKEGASKPVSVMELSVCSVKEAKSLTGENNSFGIFANSKNPLFLKALTHSQMLEWISAISSHCASEAVLESALADAFLDPVIVTSAEGIIVEVNEAALKMFGYSKMEMLGRNIKMIMPENIARHHDSYLKRYAETGVSNLIGKPRSMQAVGNGGTKFRIKLSLGVDYSKGQEVRFVGMMKKEEEEVRREDVVAKVESDVDRVMREATARLKESFEAKLKHLFEQLEFYKQRTLTSQESTDSLVPLAPQFGARFVAVDTKKVEVHERILSARGTVFNASVDGWKCAMREIELSNASEEEVEQCEKEIAEFQKLPFHKNVLRVLLFTRTTNSLRVFTTRYRETLASKLESLSSQSKYLPLDKIVSFTLDIVHALQFLHQKNIFHGNLNSESIFVNYNSANERKYSHSKLYSPIYNTPLPPFSFLSDRWRVCKLKDIPNCKCERQYSRTRAAQCSFKDRKLLIDCGNCFF